MYASRKVTMITWAKEWGPGFPGEEGGARHSRATGEGGRTAQGTLDTKPRCLGTHKPAKRQTLKPCSPDLAASESLACQP